MTMSDRDRKIVLVLVPLLLVGAFLFFVIKPKREEASRAARAVETARDRHDRALANEQRLLTAKRSFAADYTTVVRLGKAVPTDVDMPSVLVQLERAAVGTKIDFGKIAAGPRVPAGGEPSGGGAAAGPGAGGSSSAQPAAAGGEAAQSGAGQATEKANNAAAGSEQSNAARQNATGSQGSSGGGSGSSGPNNAQGVAGLDTVPLELRFTGSFFDLADFFHSLKRFVRVANQQLLVRGRLMTVDAFSFKSKSFPKIEAEMKARIFLAPEQEGATAGASPQGPSSGGGPKATPASSEPSTGTPTAAAPGVAGP